MVCGAIWNALQWRREGMFQAIPAMLKDPAAAFGVLGQNVMDTYDEEGMGYAIGNIVINIAIMS